LRGVRSDNNIVYGKPLDDPRACPLQERICDTEIRGKRVGSIFRNRDKCEDCDHFGLLEYEVKTAITTVKLKRQNESAYGQVWAKLPLEP
jgi:hypothetical protein